MILKRRLKLIPNPSLRARKVRYMLMSGHPMHTLGDIRIPIGHFYFPYKKPPKFMTIEIKI